MSKINDKRILNINILDDMDITEDWNRVLKNPQYRKMYKEATEIYNAKVNELKKSAAEEVPSETD